MSSITDKRDKSLYEVPWSISLLGFGMGTKLAIFHMCGIMLLLRAVINMGVVIFTLLYCLLGLSCGCLVKQLAILLGVVVILLLNGMLVLTVVCRKLSPHLGV